VRQAVIVRTDAGSEPAHGPPSRWLIRMGGGATWGAGRLRTLLHAVCGRRITFVHPLSAHPSRLTPVCGPGASHVCCTLLWYTAGVPLAPGAHAGAAADAACHTGHVADPCSHVPPSDDAQHAALAGPPHRTRRNRGRYDGAVPPARPAEARLTMPRAGSSSADQLGQK
jgi:hypothetical protein